MTSMIPLQRRAESLASLARAVLDTPEEPLLWQNVPVWRDFFFKRWQYGNLEAQFDGGLRLLANLSDHIECMIYLHEMQQGDRGLVRYLKSLWQPGDVVFDVGANIGVYSLMAAHRILDQGCVIAFEPVERNVARFRANVRLNAFQNVQLETAALSNRDGVGRIWVPTHNNAGMCSLHRADVSDLEQEITLLRLDTYVASTGFEHIDSIKVDVEGHEAAFLDGALETLQTYRPILCMELSKTHLERAGSDSQVILEQMKDLGYTVYGLDDAGNLFDFNPETEHQNVAFIPRS